MKPSLLLLSLSMFLLPQLAIRPAIGQTIGQAIGQTTGQAPKAQTPKAQAAKPQEPFVIEAGEVKLQALIDNCATYLGCNILVNTQEIAGGPSGEIKFQRRIETDATGCQELLATMLSRSGLALTVLDQKQGLLEVISLGGPRAREVLARAVTRTPDEILANESLRMPVTTVVPLEHINATIATNALRPFFASTGNGPFGLTLGNVGSNTAIVLAGMQDQVSQAIRMLRTCDVPQPPDANNPNGVMPLMERLAAIEKRLAALEEQLAATRQPGK